MVTNFSDYKKRLNEQEEKESSVNQEHLNRLAAIDPDNHPVPNDAESKAFCQEIKPEIIQKIESGEYKSGDDIINIMHQRFQEKFGTSMKKIFKTGMLWPSSLGQAIIKIINSDPKIKAFVQRVNKIEPITRNHPILEPKNDIIATLSGDNSSEKQAEEQFVSEIEPVIMEKIQNKSYETTANIAQELNDAYAKRFGKPISPEILNFLTGGPRKIQNTNIFQTPIFKLVERILKTDVRHLQPGKPAPLDARIKQDDYDYKKESIVPPAEVEQFITEIKPIIAQKLKNGEYHSKKELGDDLKEIFKAHLGIPYPDITDSQVDWDRYKFFIRRLHDEILEPLEINQYQFK